MSKSTLATSCISLRRSSLSTVKGGLSCKSSCNISSTLPTKDNELYRSHFQEMPFNGGHCSQNQIRDYSISNLVTGVNCNPKSKLESTTLQLSIKDHKHAISGDISQTTPSVQATRYYGVRLKRKVSRSTKKEKNGEIKGRDGEMKENHNDAFEIIDLQQINENDASKNSINIKDDPNNLFLAKEDKKKPYSLKVGTSTRDESVDNQEEFKHTKCAVTTFSTTSVNHAKMLAKHLGIPFQSPDELLSDFVLIVSDKERLMLKNTGLLQNYYIDFYQIHHELCSSTHWAIKPQVSEYSVVSEEEARDRIRKNSENMKKPRFKTFKNLFPQDNPKWQEVNQGDLTSLRILDVSGGMGANSYIYAHAGAQVILVEKDPVLYSLLYEGYELAKTLPGLSDVMKRISIVHADPLKLVKGELKGKKYSNLKDWDVVFMEPRYYDGISQKQSYVNRNLEEVLKPFVECDLDWNEYSRKIEELYATCIAKSPVIFKYPVMSTKFIVDGKWIVQKHESQYIDSVYKRYKDQEYEYQLFLPSSDPRSRRSLPASTIERTRDYLNLRFKEHQRNARKAGGKDKLREIEQQKELRSKKKKRDMIEIVDDDTPVSKDELSSIDIERIRRLTRFGKKSDKF